MTEELKYWLKSLVRKCSKAEGYRDLAKKVYYSEKVKIKYLKRGEIFYKTIDVDYSILYDALIKLAEECEESILKITKSNFFKEEIKNNEMEERGNKNEQN